MYKSFFFRLSQNVFFTALGTCFTIFINGKEFSGLVNYFVLLKLCNYNVTEDDYDFFSMIT